MSHVALAFAPVRANVYVAPVGTTGPVDGATVPAGFFGGYLGAVDLAAGFTLAPSGTPTRTIVREMYDDQVFFVDKAPSDDLPNFGFTFLESGKQVVQTALGVAIDASGAYVFTGKIQANVAVVIDLADASATPKLMRYYLPNASPALSGNATASGADKLLRWPLQFVPEPATELSGALYKSWSSWEPDTIS